jgi:hypothetical protein
LARVRRAAAPAVEPKSIASERRNSLALLLPALSTHSTPTFWPVSASSSQPKERSTRLLGL